MKNRAAFRTMSGTSDSAISIAKKIVWFGATCLLFCAGDAAAETPSSLASKVMAAGCGPDQPIDWRVTNTDSDIQVVSKLAASAKPRFLASSTGSEPCEQLLAAWIGDHAKSDALVQSLRALTSYLVVTPGPASAPNAPTHKFPPFAAGAPGSSRRAVIAALENALIAHDTPVAQAALLFFTELDDNALAAKAKTSSRAKLKLFPWLMHPEWASWIVDGLRPEEREVWQKAYPQNARTALADFTFHPPYDLPYGFASLRKLSRLTHSPLPNPSDDQARLADGRLWDAAYAIANEGMLVAGRPDLVDERKKTREYTSRSLRRFFLGPEPEVNVNDLLLVATKVIDTGSGLGAEDASFDMRMSLSNTASLLTRFELERRAMVLFALLTAKKHGIAVPAATDLVSADLELDRISKEKHTGIIDTVAVDTFDQAAIVKKNSAYDAAAKSCELDKDKMVLVGRHVSFDSGLFSESYRLTCRDSRQFSYEYVDQIPFGYAAAWRRHPRLFDFMGISITSGIADETDWRTYTPDIDLVRAVPHLSIPMLLASLRNPGISWPFLREYMLLDYQPTFGWLAHVDAPVGMFNDIVAGQTNVAPTDAYYDGARNDLIGRMTTFLNYVAKKPIVNALMPIALRMDDKVYVCIPVSGGESCGNQPNRTKQQLLSALLALDADAKASLRALTNQYMFGIDTSKCKSTAQRGTTRTAVLFNPQFTKYLVRYLWNDAATSQECDFGFERQLNTTPDVTEALKKALSQDPSALAKFDLDIAAVGTDAGHRTAVAIGNAMQMTEKYAAAEQSLHAAALYSQYRIFMDFHPNETGYSFTNYGALANAVKWPILRDQIVNTVPGLTYDKEFEAFDYVFNEFQPKYLRFREAVAGEIPMIQPPETEPKVLSSIVSLNEQLVNQALQMAETQINTTIGALRSQQDNWSIFISIGTNGFTPNGILQFSFNGIGARIGFSMPAIAITDITPNWGGIRIPITIPHNGGGANAVLASAQMLGSPPPDLPGTSVAIPWTAAPQVSWGPGDLDLNTPANRVLFVGLLGRAGPALTDADVQHVLDALKLPVFPADLAQFLFNKSYEGFEMTKIAAGEWYPTSINLQLLPVKAPGQPCPISGCVDPNNPQELDKYITDFNKSELERFDNEVKAAQTAAGDKHAFASDIPAVRLTYGPGFKVMQTEFSWPAKKDGHLITMRSLQETPVFVIDKIRANPSGHEFEKWAVAITDEFATPSDVSAAALKKAKAAFIDEIGEEFRQMQDVSTTPLFKSFSKQLEKAWNDFWSSWKSHGEKEIGAGSKDAFIEPFVPPPLSTPMLRFFDPQWQHAFDNGMNMENWLKYERSTEFYKRVGRGGNPIGPRQ